MKKTLLKIFTLVAFASVLYSCSSVAFTGRKRLLLYNDSQIVSLADDSYKSFMDSNAVSTNRVSTQMVTEVGSRLVGALTEYLKGQGQESYLTGLNWGFNLVQSKEVNAFCLPNGKIVVYEGLLPYADTPDFLAVVLGHEIAHAVARHGNERMSEQAALQAVGNIASAVIGTRSESLQGIFNVAFSVGGQYGILLPYSRKHEYEADEIGLYIMYLAGYDISQAPKLWEKMMQGGSARVPELLSTHPSDANRIANLQKIIEGIRAEEAAR